jgi:alpha-L-fucosidase
MFEKGLPGKDPFSKGADISTIIPLETCETINNSWGYNKEDKNLKNTADLIRYLVRAAGNNANFLLNVGPKPDGTIQDEFKERLTDMGKWLRSNGESIYGTRGGPIPPQSWGVTTYKGNTVYIHVLADTDAVIAVPDLGGKITGAKLLGGKPVNYTVTKLGTLFELPGTGRDPYDTVIAVALGK